MDPHIPDTLYRPVCELLGSRLPLVLAGMGGVARSELVAAVCEAGGFGFLGMVREHPDFIRAEVARVRERTGRSFGVNVIPAATEARLLAGQIAACIDLQVPVVGLFWDLWPAVVDRLRAAGILVVCQVGAVEEARAAERAGAAILIVQGREAGGHVRGERPLLELLPEVLAKVAVPVLAAGGIADGADVANLLSLGAQGAVLGTALLATHESFAHAHHKQRIVAAREGDTRLTQAFHINWPPGARVRVLANEVTRGERGDPFTSPRTVIGEDAGRPIVLFSTDSPLRSTTGDLEAMALYAGEGAARIGTVEGAAQRLRAIALDAATALAARPGPLHERVDVSSPVCYAEELDAAYVSPIGREELLASLNELLEAERAGARVAMQFIKEGGDGALGQLGEQIRRDEVKWCGMLIRAIQSIDAAPSTRTGAFYDKAMAIEDPGKRLAFLNRGQAWVVDKLTALLPRLRDGALRDQLAEMCARHADNIVQVGGFLDRRALEAISPGTPARAGRSSPPRLP
ncbi:nitronate monooxygenase [Variovorax sp. M-6]|uniref:nitronate monooxygenase n=1 Tax=Variovorax sp. M-6 TaxID=3233041 RepID=UPI003F96B6F8